MQCACRYGYTDYSHSTRAGTSNEEKNKNPFQTRESRRFFAHHLHIYIPWCDTPCRERPRSNGRRTVRMHGLSHLQPKVLDALQHAPPIRNLPQLHPFPQALDAHCGATKKNTFLGCVAGVAKERREEGGKEEGTSAYRRSSIMVPRETQVPSAVSRVYLSLHGPELA